MNGVHGSLYGSVQTKQIFYRNTEIGFRTWWVSGPNYYVFGQNYFVFGVSVSLFSVRNGIKWPKCQNSETENETVRTLLAGWLAAQSNQCWFTILTGPTIKSREGERDEGKEGRKEGRRQWQSDPTLNDRTNDLPSTGRRNEGRTISGMNALSAHEAEGI